MSEKIVDFTRKLLFFLETSKIKILFFENLEKMEWKFSPSKRWNRPLFPL